MMDKEKILEQARKKNIDEGAEHSKSKGIEIGYKIFLGMSIFLIIFNLFVGEKTFSVQSMFWGFIAAEGYTSYQFSGERSSKFRMIFSGLASIIYLINHILYSIV